MYSLYALDICIYDQQTIWCDLILDMPSFFLLLAYCVSTGGGCISDLRKARSTYVYWDALD